ncbi:hypothetical protein AVEN_248684-2-1, partial [Araneus ventricosus]
NKFGNDASVSSSKMGDRGFMGSWVFDSIENPPCMLVGCKLNSPKWSNFIKLVLPKFGVENVDNGVVLVI